MTIKSLIPAFVRPVDILIDCSLPETLSEVTDFDELRAISLALNEVYDKYCYTASVFAAYQNNGLLLDLMANIRIQNGAYRVKAAVYWSVARRECKIAICEVFKNNWTVKNKLIEK